MCDLGTSRKLHQADLDEDDLGGKHRAIGTRPWSQTSSLADDSVLPQFLVGSENGFLPRQDPLSVLPERFAELEGLLQRMPITRRDGSLGLLSTGEFGDAVERDLPLYEVDDIVDTRLLAALYRDYTFAASAYLLEPCDRRWRQSKEYGLGRDRLPKQIAVPLCKVAQKIGAKPFMEYALSYALYNWQRIDPQGPIQFDNLRIIRAFAGTKSEAGFILVHIAMVRYSGDLVRAVLDVLDAAGSRPEFDRGLQDVFATLTNITREMETMWARSSATGYQQFRTFIMGTKNQPMFPRGVVYERVSDEPQFYRGESGANDSMIPTMDNLLQLTESLPDNPLTQILRDFRSYRPADHSAFVEWVQRRANQVGVRAYAEQDPISSVWYLKGVDMIRNFRLRHWNFTKEYILKHSDHPVATGGSPIVTWLPNQLRVILKIMDDSASRIADAALPDGLRADLVGIRARVSDQLAALDQEVASLRIRFPDQDRLAVA